MKLILALTFLVTVIFTVLFVSDIIIEYVHSKNYCTIKLNDANNQTSYLTGECIE